MKKPKLEDCIVCLLATLTDARGWCAACRRRHRCGQCGAVSASVRVLRGTCAACRDRNRRLVDAGQLRGVEP